ncbi:MAG: hypothetical protein M3134_08170, partial [Actinomycetota bacterium]|nr:hypothetical protein [Actinomycetota bacterium]
GTAARADTAGTADRAREAEDAERAGLADRAITAADAELLAGRSADDFVAAETQRTLSVALNWGNELVVVQHGPLVVNVGCRKDVNMASPNRTDIAFAEGASSEPGSFMVGPVAQLGGGDGPTLGPTTSEAQRRIGAAVLSRPRDAPRPPILTTTTGATYLVAPDGEHVVAVDHVTHGIGIGGGCLVALRVTIVG